MINVDAEIALFSENAIQRAKAELVAKGEVMPIGFFLLSYENEPDHLGIIPLAIANLFKSREGIIALPYVIQQSWDIAVYKSKKKEVPCTLQAVLLITDSYISPLFVGKNKKNDLSKQIAPSEHPERREGILHAIYRKDTAQGFYHLYERVEVNRTTRIVFGEVYEENGLFEGGNLKDLFPKKNV
jgi:hypothetical protein